MTPISTPIAWLFAQPIQGAENGFSVTGGVFNYTADLHFTDTGHTAQVKYVFKVTFDRYLIINLSGFLLNCFLPVSIKRCRVKRNLKYEDCFNFRVWMHSTIYKVTFFCPERFRPLEESDLKSELKITLKNLQGDISLSPIKAYRGMIKRSNFMRSKLAFFNFLQN
jgi:hypothetical protein